ncbi:DNA helicase RecQ [Paraclostridium sordellii]|uniref:DNA helicase RecQ n=1 Tax=Paraclostridium sordellii TaxID=1505 RepID=UPI0006DD138B|nr:DNA helicase RecQ [Paeniclostridium sordellii]
MNLKSLDILKKYYGYTTFRKGQEEIINNILNGNDILAIMPTGGGKSICYQIPALMLNGITIVISPLISLMKDQVDTLKSMGINATLINSSLSSLDFNKVINGIKEDEYKIIYIAPERLDSYEFTSIIRYKTISQIAIDEAHCVSQWGHDFRVSYRKISSFINSLESRPIVTAFTATASIEVREDIIRLLTLDNPKLFITGFNRENLNIKIEKSSSKNKYLLSYLENHKSESGIIYTATRKEVDKIYEGLIKRGYSASKYHAGLGIEERRLNQEAFTKDNVSIMVATNAFGMGIDKPNIRYVIHYNMPQSIENYYQEIGRAGRDGEKSECVLLFAPGDVHIQKYLIELGSENPDRKNLQYKKLREMLDIIYSNDCYRKSIINYFGEEFEGNCNNCSNCLDTGELIDKTLDAQKVISCIARMKRSFGITMIIDVLRGSKNKKVLQFGFDKLSTYGIMKDYSQEELKTFINTLISHGFIDSIDGTYPTIKLNESSMKIIKGDIKVEFKESKVSKNLEVSNELYEILREARFKIANEEKIAPYMIFGDGTLRIMASKYPTNRNSMLNISGVGEIKYDKYGKVFESIISKYVDENNINKTVDTNEIDFMEITTDKDLYNILYDIRSDTANKEKVLPPMIISKNSLKEISGRYPITDEQLKDISGFGPVKVEKYGSRILEEVVKYVKEKEIDPNWTYKKRLKLIIDGDSRSNEEIAIDMLKDGESLENVSNELEVSISTILGYISDILKEGKSIDFEINLNKYFTKEEEELIINVCESQGIDKISIIKKNLPDYIRYESIRSVILKKYYSL